MNGCLFRGVGCLLTLVVTVVVAVFAIPYMLGSVVTDMSYRVVDQRTLVVTACASGDFGWTRVSSVRETPAAVRVTVEDAEWWIPLPGTGTGVCHDFTVSLGSDLGARIVEDGTGHQARLIVGT